MTNKWKHITSDALKIEPNSAVHYYFVWFNFECIRHYYKEFVFYTLQKNVTLVSFVTVNGLTILNSSSKMSNGLSAIVEKIKSSRR